MKINKRIKREIENDILLVLLVVVIVFCVGTMAHQLTTNWSTSMSMIEEALH